MRAKAVSNPFFLIPLIVFILTAGGLIVSIMTTKALNKRVLTLTAQGLQLRQDSSRIARELSDLKNQDQYKINQSLVTEMRNINTLYKKAADMYENVTDLKAQDQKTDTFDMQIAQIFRYLSDRNYASSEAGLSELEKSVNAAKIKLASVSVSAGVGTEGVSAPVSNTPPASGFSRQTVQSDVGTFTVDIVSADLNTTRVVVDTASDGTCHDNCPVMAVGAYAGRSGAFAAVNGSYFCPAEYPSCVGKTNSFDTLLMNENKIYFNSENNVYSTVPAAIFLGGSVRYVGQSLEWGRDTGVDGVIANQPLLLSGGTIVFGGNSDPKQGSKGLRSFVGSKGGTVYIGVVHNATVAEVSHVLKTMGLDGALNLDSGGSTALWVNGAYKVGPGRNVPNAVLFLRK